MSLHFNIKDISNKFSQTKQAVVLILNINNLKNL